MAQSGKDWPGYAKGTVPDLPGIEWRFQDATPPDVPNRDPEVVYIPLGYSKKVLPKGHKKAPENKALDLDIIFEKDVELVLRDGVKVRTSPVCFFLLANVHTRSTSISTVRLTVMKGKKSPLSFPIHPTAKAAQVPIFWM